MMEIEDYLKPGYFVIGHTVVSVRGLPPAPSPSVVTAGGTKRSEAGGIGQGVEQPWRVVDATSFGDMEQCFQSAADQLGQLDGVINCVGSVILKPAHLTSEMEWAETVAKNLTSAFATVHAAGKVLRQGGSVVLYFDGSRPRRLAEP